MKKIQTKLFHYKHSDQCTLKKLLYTYTLRCTIASRVSPKTKYSLACIEFPMGSRFHISKCKIDFTQFSFIGKYLKLKEIEYFLHYIKFEM